MNVAFRINQAAVACMLSMPITASCARAINGPPRGGNDVLGDDSRGGPG